MIGKFFKNFGKGLLYILVTPLTLVVLSLYAVFGFAIFIGLSLKSVVLFFQGKTIFTDLKEDEQAKEILENKVHEEEIIHDPKPTNPYSIYPSESSMYNSAYSNNEPSTDDDTPSIFEDPNNGGDM